MYISIRANILNAAIHAAINTSSEVVKYGSIFPNPENDWLTYDRLVREVPELETVFLQFTSQQDAHINPARAFFSINPPGTWMRLREIIGPDSMDMTDLHEQLDSEEALGAVLQHFLPELERQQDEWYADRWVR